MTTLVTPTLTATEVVDDSTASVDTPVVSTPTDVGQVDTVVDEGTDDTMSVSGTVDGTVGTAGGLLADTTDTVQLETTQETSLDVSALSPTVRSTGMTATPSSSPPSSATTAPGTGVSRPAGSTAAGDDPTEPSPDGSGPVSPLTGGAMVGGAAVLTGLAGRAVLGGSDTPKMRSWTGSEVRTAVRSVVARWRDRLWPALGLFGYQRFDDSDPLEHAGRERLYDLVRAEPGVHLSALGDSADLPLSTARYHLRILEHEGLVRGVKLRGKRRFFPPDVGAEALVAALADDATATVLRSLVREGPGSVSELADRLDRDPSTVSHHLDRLADDGLVEREREGPAVVSTAVPAVESAVEEFETGGSDVVQPRPAATSD